MTTSTPATEAIRAAGVEHRIVTYGFVETIEEAAELRSVAVSSIIKTLVVRLASDDYVMVLVSGDRSIDWKKLRALVGVARISLADRDQLVGATGYERGTVTPFGTTRTWPIYVDAAIADAGEVSLGGGAHGVAIHLSGDDLIAHFGATVADVTKG